jgi:hypothetical protein
VRTLLTSPVFYAVLVVFEGACNSGAHFFYIEKSSLLRIKVCRQFSTSIFHLAALLNPMLIDNTLALDPTLSLEFHFQCGELNLTVLRIKVNLIFLTCYTTWR